MRELTTGDNIVTQEEQLQWSGRQKWCNTEIVKKESIKRILRTAQKWGMGQNGLELLQNS